MNSVKCSIKTLTADGRWQVPFEDAGHWRTGIYRSEFLCHEEIRELE